MINKKTLSCLGVLLVGLNTINFQVTAKPQTKAKWTVMVFMSGDNDLEEYIVPDLEKELGVVGSTPEVKVVALADRISGYDRSRKNWTNTKLFEVKKGMKALPNNALADWGEKNYGDPKTLIDFVKWSKTNHPAEKYALYFWGHGWNWRPGYTMEDKTNKDSLDPHEIKKSIPKLGFIDMVAYDGCNMASIEVEALWYKHAQSIVHSQEYVGGDGIEYDVVLKKLKENPNLTAEQVAIETNKSASLNKEKTGSAVVLDNRWETLIKNLNELSLELTKNLDKHHKEYKKAFDNSQYFIDAPEDKDLYDLASNLKKYVKNENIKLKSEALRIALKSVVLDEWHTKEYTRANGISISILESDDENIKYYKKNDFSKLTKWDDFIEAYQDFEEE